MGEIMPHQLQLTQKKKKLFQVNKYELYVYTYTCAYAYAASEPHKL